MAIIYTYPQASPSSADQLIGTQIDPDTEENKTVQFAVGSVAGLATNNYLETTVTITNAEWLALNATPKELIAAPGASKGIKLLEASVFFDYNASNFTWTTDVNFVINSVEFADIPSGASGIGADTIYNCEAGLEGIIAANTALVTAGGGTTAGGGQVQIKLRYQILDISTTSSF